MERGLVPITIEDINPHPQTLTNYCALLAHQSGVSICDKVIKNPLAGTPLKTH